jgi:hypothetical protein
VFCTQCGQQNPDDSRFCARCGAPVGDGDGQGNDATSTFALSALEGALDADHEAAEPGPTAAETLPAGSALLVVKRGPNAGSRFLLDADVTTAGRHPDSDIFLDDITVSRRHVEVLRRPGGYVVRDVGSLNGTYVNRSRVEEGPLSDGDELQVGKFKLVFVAGSEADPT